MKFTKMQGAGNDFVVIERGKSHRNWSKLAIDMCDRHYGIGADGLLIAAPSKVANFKMRIFNADGSESRVCGNGLRCLVKHYMDTNKDKTHSEITIETAVGIRTARIHDGKGIKHEIQVNMGEPKIGYNGTSAQTIRRGNKVDIKLAMNRTIIIDGQDFLLSLVSIGNPHAVYFSSDPVIDFPLADIGPKIELHKIFANETNFEVVKFVDRKQVEARVWERGVGETLACGSGACAITVAGNLLGYLDNNVEVKLQGGTLTVEWDRDGDIFLRGPTVTVFTGDW